MKKQTGLNMIAQVMAFCINILVGFFLTPFIVKNIGVEANGFVALANNFIDYVQLFTVAVNSMAGRFITIKIHQNKQEDAGKYFSSVFFANVFFSVILTVVFTTVVIFLDSFLDISPELITDIKVLWAFIFLNFILSLFASTFSVSTFVRDRLDKIALCNARSVIIKAAVLILCYTFFRPYTFFVGVATLFMGINNLISNILYRNKLTPELKVTRSSFDFKCIKELIASGIWNLLNKLSSILSSGLDLLITNIFVSATAMGIFTNSKFLSNLILSLFATLSSIFAPQLTIAFANDDYNEMKKQLISSIKLLSLFASIPIAVLVGYGLDFYKLWLPTQDAPFLYILTLITSFNLIFALPLEPLYNIFTATNKIKISSIALICFSACSITTVFIGLNFINNETAKIIYIASVGAFYNVLRLLTFLPIYGAKCLNFKLSTFYPVIAKNTLSVVILSCLALILNRFAKADSWLMLFLDCVVVGILGIVGNSFVLFNKKERRETIQSLLSVIKRKIDKNKMD